MKSKKLLFAGMFIATLVVMGLSSCKKCVVADSDSSTGIIITEAIIYPKIGYMTQEPGGYYFNGTGIHGDDFEVSFDGGATKGPVDWNSYAVLGNPQMVNCKASFVRDVTLDDLNNAILYNVTATTCESCSPERYVENYVLIPKVPSGYSVFFDSDVVTN